MNEKLEAKLKKLLSKAGFDESKIDEVVAELKDEKEGSDEVEIEVEESAEAPVEETSQESETENGESVEQETETPVEEVAPVENTSTEPEEAEGVENAEQESVESAPVESIPPVEVEQPSIYENRIAELEKANDGLLARIDSLEDALRKSGVLQDEKESVGFDENKVSSAEAQADGLSDFITKRNSASHF